MKYTVYRCAEPWGAPAIELTRDQLRGFMLDTTRHFKITAMRDRGRFALYLERGGRSYNLVIDARH